MTPTDIKDVRKGLGLSQARFAALLGLSEETISEWELGRQFLDLHELELLEAFQKAIRKAGPFLRNKLADQELHNAKWWLKKLYLILKVTYSGKEELVRLKTNKAFDEKVERLGSLLSLCYPENPNISRAVVRDAAIEVMLALQEAGVGCGFIMCDAGFIATAGAKGDKAITHPRAFEEAVYNLVSQEKVKKWVK